MTNRPIHVALVAGVVAAGTAMAFPALAQDGGRFRGGIALEGGTLVTQVGRNTSPSATLVSGGLQGQVGYQFNNFVGVYFVPSFDLVGGHGYGGFGASGAAIVDLTFRDRFAVGAGPDVGLYSPGEGPVYLGVEPVGARLHLAAYPLVLSRRPRRHGLELGLDLRLLGFPGNNDGALVAVLGTIGYAAF